jgi:hypothetical protein
MTTAGATTAQAQEAAPADTTMNKVLVIENEYIPQISEAQKINVVPEVKAPTVTPKQVEYATGSSPAGHIPAGTMPAITAAETQPQAKRGYARIGLGSHGNIDLLGNYLFSLGSRDRLNLNLQADGMNAKLKLKDSDGEYKWRSKYYRMRGGLDYTHQFSALDLNVAAHGGLTTLNHNPEMGLLKQRFLTGDVLVGVKSTDTDAEIRYKASTNYIFYQRRPLAYSGKQTEHRVRTMAEVTGNIAEGQAITVGAEMNNIMLSESTTYAEAEPMKSYTTIDLNPHYNFDYDAWQVRLGAHVDLATGYGKSVQAAPDIRIGYNFSDTYTFYINATGGRRLNDFRQAETENPYALISGNLTNSYEQLNASVGVQGTVSGSFHFNVFGGYQKMKDDLYANLDPTTEQPRHLTPSLFFNADTRNAFVGINLGYDYRSKVNLKGEMVCRSWENGAKGSADEGLYPLLFKPRFEVNLGAMVRPVKGLTVELTYNYENRCNTDGVYVADVSDLSARADYNFYKGIGFYARLGNILNKSFQHYYYQPTEGLNILGGLTFRF